MNLTFRTLSNIRNRFNIDNYLIAVIFNGLEKRLRKAIYGIKCDKIFCPKGLFSLSSFQTNTREKERVEVILLIESGKFQHHVNLLKYLQETDTRGHSSI